MNLTYDVSLESGECKLVLVYPDNEVVIVKEGTGSGEGLISVPEGDCRLITVGKSAKGEIKIEFSELDGCTAEKLES